MNSLDLHGTKHEDAFESVEDLILENQLPVEIITGNSLEMQKIVKSVIKKYKLAIFLPNPSNLGSLVVVENLK